MLLKLMLVAVSIFASESSVAWTGNDFVRFCARAQKFLDEGPLPTGEASEGLICLAYINGFVNGQQMLDRGEGRLVCVPDGYSSQQGVRIVNLHLRNHPTELNKHPAELISDALAPVMRCK